jgi:hypothetical protein
MATMNKKSLLKSFSLAVAAISLSVSSSSLVKADTVEGKTLLDSPENRITSQLWGQLSNDFGVCQVAQSSSDLGTIAMKLENNDTDSQLASAKNLDLKASQSSSQNKSGMVAKKLTPNSFDTIKLETSKNNQHVICHSK